MESVARVERARGGAMNGFTNQGVLDGMKVEPDLVLASCEEFDGKPGEVGMT